LESSAKIGARDARGMLLSVVTCLPASRTTADADPPPPSISLVSHAGESPERLDRRNSARMRAKFRPSASSRSASEWGGIIAIRDRAINRALARASRVIRFNRDFAPRVAGRVAVRSKREPTGGILPRFPSLQLKSCRRRARRGDNFRDGARRIRGLRGVASPLIAFARRGLGARKGHVRGRCNGWRGSRERRRIYGPTLRLFRGKVHRAKRIYGTPEIMVDGRGGSPASSPRKLREFSELPIFSPAARSRVADRGGPARFIPLSLKSSARSLPSPSPSAAVQEMSDPSGEAGGERESSIDSSRDPRGECISVKASIMCDAR